MFPIVRDVMNVFNFSSVFSNRITTFSAHEEEDQGILGRGGQVRDDGQRRLSRQAKFISSPLGARYTNPRHSAGSEAAC